MGKSRREPVSAKKRATTTGSYSPVHIRDGEILTDVTKKQWRIGRAVGAGGFGEIYLVSSDISKPVPQDAMYAVKIEPHKSGPLFVEMNFYLRVAKQEMINDWKEERGVKKLGMPHYISFGSHVYQGDKYRFLILERFGQDLSKIFNKCKRKFHIKTVLTLGIQILDVLEYIHSHGYIHADIKASNLLLGYNSKDEDNIYLLDYGLACRYIDNYGIHKEYNPDQRKAHDGTLEYTSRDAHVGAHSRRGDLEVLAYNMIQWLSGKLPWEDEVSDPEKVALEKNNCMNNIPLFLKKCFDDEAPAVLHHFLKYVVSLNFDTKPDYDYCKTLLRQGIRQAGYADNGKFNFASPPAKLKSKKRYHDPDVENLAELKPIKVPRTSARQPCVPVQPNCNRITRQQTAATTLVLRSKETFDWVKVLQSNPEKRIRSQNATQEQPKSKGGRKREKKSKDITEEIKVVRVRENPLDNPTPAMFEVMKAKNAIANSNAGKRNRSDSSCSSPVFYEKNSLTPAMEEVIRRREILKRIESESEFRPVMTATSARANRLRVRNESKLPKPLLQPSVALVDIRRVTRKISAPEPKSTVAKRRGRPRKFSLPDQSKLVTETNKVATDISALRNSQMARRTSQRIRKKRKFKKAFPTTPKYMMKKKLNYSPMKLRRRREVSPSEITFVPRLRSGLDTSEDNFCLKTWPGPCPAKTQIRHYAAKGVSPKISKASGVVRKRHSLRTRSSLAKKISC